MNILMPGEPDLVNVARIDHGIIPFTRNCENAGMSIDREHFTKLGEYLDVEINDLTGKILEYVPRESLDAFVHATKEIDADEDFNVDSPDQIARLLFQHLRLGSGIELTTTPTGDRISTGKKQLERLRDEHPIVPLILQRREYTKLQSTYAEVFPRIAEYKASVDQWKLYYKIGLTFTSTGRMTCSRLHQIPIRTKVGRKIREGFIPEPGMVFISADYGGLELRVLAHCAREAVMTDVFWQPAELRGPDGKYILDGKGEPAKNPNGDIHQKTQDGLNMPDSMDATAKRLASKRVNFGIVYGTTDLGLWLTLQSDGVTCTREQCAGFMEGFFRTYRGVEPYIEKHHHRARRYGIAYNIFGRVTQAPEFRSVHKRIRREGERRIQNWVIQSTATEIFKIGAARVNEFCDEVQAGLFGRPRMCRPLLPIHDQVLLECDVDISDECAVCVADIMSEAVQLRVPLRVDANCQPRWKK